MNDPATVLYLGRQREEIWIMCDGRVPGTCNRLYRERRAWGSHAAVEYLGHGCAVLMVRPGGARRLTR
jgi:hypothetical protein